MESQSHRRRRRRRSSAATAEEDRLSSLPDDLLQSILRGLPLKHAVRTSALSRRWAHRWLRALAASLVLDLTDRDFARGQPPARAAATVTRCLWLHAEHGAPLHAFRVALVSPPPRSRRLVGDVVGWVSAAVARGAREVEVDLAPPPPQEEEDDGRGAAALVKLPADVFRARSSLERLALGVFSLRTLAFPAAGLAGLRSLSLTNTNVTDDAVRLVLTTCPALESLVLIRCPLLASVTVASETLRVLEVAGCRAVRALRVAAPALESLAFHGRIFYFHGRSYGDPVVFELGAMPALRDAYLSHLGCDFDFGVAQDEQTYPYLYNAVAHARTLTICSAVLVLLQQAHSADETAAYANAQNLEELQLLMGTQGSLDVELEHLSTFFTIASLGPVLKRLFVRLISPADLYYGGGRSSVAAAAADETIFDQLAFIKVVNFSGTKRELRLLRFLLKRAPVLEEMVVVVAVEGEGAPGDEQLKALQKQVPRLRKASRQARVSVCRPDQDDSPNHAHTKFFHEE
ncbi:unnamed protein product [Urochloa decumbens]|uniref:F-box domain-containing protein n=1 Tax=Urochloa decumbens TaxID=240449 RepID=A0ABC9ACR5_9POAL